MIGFILVTLYIIAQICSIPVAHHGLPAVAVSSFVFVLGLVFVFVTVFVFLFVFVHVSD